MTIEVKIPTPLQKLTNGEASVSAEGSTVIGLIEDLDKQFPGVLDRLTENGELRRFVLVYVNGEDVRFQDGGGTAVKEGDDVSIVPAIAGG